MQPETTNSAADRPRILWLPSIIFSTTALISMTLVPWYGVVHGYSWVLVLLALIFLWANGLSITAGYHRLWSHNTYKAHPILRVAFALFGAAAVQNSILIWASGHRQHHRHIDDDEQDPYSAKRGLWFSHIGWMLRDHESGHINLDNVRDLQRDPVVAWQHKYYLPLAIGMNVIPPVIVGWALGDIIGSLLLMGVLRLLISHHTTFFINSLAHFWGKQPYTDQNSAKDNGILALLTYGEGYHNFHHMFQNDYRNGIRWWQFDPTKWLIKAASWIGLTHDLNQIPSFKIQHALITMQFKRAEQSLDGAADSDHWREYLEREYQQFAKCLNEWKTLRQQWYEQKRAQLSEATQELSDELHRKWEQTALHSQFQALEYALKLQRKRLNYLTLQLA
jgi:stearoyl-CoA desaturase (Delta-9 desaturase)